MIFALSKNKYSKRFISDETLLRSKLFFESNEDVWFSGKELRIKLEYDFVSGIVNKLRIEGCPIVSNRKQGYCYTHNKVIIKKCYDVLRDQFLVQLTACKQLKKHL